MACRSRGRRAGRNYTLRSASTCAEQGATSSAQMCDVRHKPLASEHRASCPLPRWLCRLTANLAEGSFVGRLPHRSSAWRPDPHS